MKIRGSVVSWGFISYFSPSAGGHKKKNFSSAGVTSSCLYYYRSYAQAKAFQRLSRWDPIFPNVAAGRVPKEEEPESLTYHTIVCIFVDSTTRAPPGTHYICTHILYVYYSITIKRSQSGTETREEWQQQHAACSCSRNWPFDVLQSTASMHHCQYAPQKKTEFMPNHYPSFYIDYSFIYSFSKVARWIYNMKFAGFVYICQQKKNEKWFYK